MLFVRYLIIAKMIGLRLVIIFMKEQKVLL